MAPVGALLTFCNKMSEHTARHVEQARLSISLVKWLAIVALVFLPFSFSDGIADWRYLIVAPLTGIVWIVAQLHFWRSESILAGAGAFMIAIVAHNLSANAYIGEPPFGHSVQWIALFLAVAATPLVVFRASVLNFCGLQKTEE
jgi:heme O synthase-like polyprenyltransferase